MHELMLYRCFGRARSLRSDRAPARAQSLRSDQAPARARSLCSDQTSVRARSLLTRARSLSTRARSLRSDRAEWTFGRYVVTERNGRPEPSIIEPEIPDQLGRKKVTKADKKRKRGVNESPSKKKEKFLKRIMHCGICGAPNHNSRFHKKNPKKPFVSGESSQPEASQGVSTQPTQLEK
ncbi:hypothetical protein F2Q69_00055729 [Brassica cretica]|uniref:Uncharacterized protein n=1 Tax=Brassica cretica TaxID=69181 RepID=A0A8S9MY34_BRACR|nr:hypothetical protein F2Q69_00055729 [Brassica cretica]